MAYTNTGSDPYGIYQAANNQRYQTLLAGRDANLSRGLDRLRGDEPDDQQQQRVPRHEATAR